MRILEGKNLTKSFDDTKIIENVSIFVNEGEMVSLLGVSGKGKTTLFNIMSGLEVPDCGEVYLKGECITGKAGYIGYMQQSDLLLPFKSVIKNVMIPLILKGVDKKEAYRRAEEILKEFSLLECRDLYPGQISGGMRQRVALARSFLIGSEVMLMDEPFSALDAFSRGEMQKWFKAVVRENNMATLFITHDIDEAIILSDRIYILGGEVGTITDVIEVNIDKADYFSEEFVRLKKRIAEKIIRKV